MRILRTARLRKLVGALALLSTSLAAHARGENVFRVFDVTDYGANPQSTDDDTDAIQAAIDAAEAAAPAIVLFPRGVYMVRNLEVNGPFVTLQGAAATLEQTTGGSANQLLHLHADDLTVRGLDLDGNHPTVTISGSGFGINVQGDRIVMEDVTVRDVKNTGIHCNSEYEDIRIENCNVLRSGANGIRARADRMKILGGRIENWNAGGASSGIRAILCDGQSADMDFLHVEGTEFRMTEARPFSDAILVDCGDNNLTNGDSVRTPVSGGTASDVGGKAAWTIDAGHGFAPGDSIWIAGSGQAAYDNVSHKINRVIWASGGLPGDGNPAIRVVNANTITLHADAASARANTNKINLTDTGTGAFQLSPHGFRPVTVTGATAINTSTDEITVTAHGWYTGVMARLTQSSSSSVLPAGLSAQALVVSNTNYTAAGSSTTYQRPKKVRSVTFRDLKILYNPSTSVDSNVIKTNNIDNLLMERVVVHQPPDNSPTNASWRLGQGLRKVVARDCRFSHQVINNVIAWVPDLTIENCEIGDADNVPVTCLVELQVGKFNLRNSTLRFSAAALETGDGVLPFRDADCEGWTIYNNIFEGNSTNRTRVMQVNDVTHFAHSGLLRYFGNTRLNVGNYAGLQFTPNTAPSNVINATAHTLETGDQVQLRTTGTLPTGLAANTNYWIRRTEENKLTLHTSEADASDNTSPIQYTTTGSGTHSIVSMKIGCQLSAAGPRDVSFFQKSGDGRNFYSEASPTHPAFQYRLGDIVWNMNPAQSGAMGWICTKTGVAGTTAATFRALPNVQ